MVDKKYSKLVKYQAIEKSWEDAKEVDPNRKGESDFGLLKSESDPPDLHIITFIDAAFFTSGFSKIWPADIAVRVGRDRLSFAEYLAELEVMGLDIKSIQADAAKRREAFIKGATDAKDKAAAFFHLIQTEWFVSDEDVSKYLDGLSIYELLELVLAHSDETRARINAKKRHAENHARKAKVFHWLDANMKRFKSMDAAAETISDTVVPVVFRTARDWVGEWKKLRSASTP